MFRYLLNQLFRNLGRLLLIAVVPTAMAATSAAPAAAPSTGQVKVVVEGDLNATLTDFVNQFIDQTDLSKHVDGLTLTIGKGAFLGDIGVYFPQDAEPGTYDVQGDTATGTQPATASLTCAGMMDGSKNAACASYTGDATGSVTLTQTGQTFSGSFDVTLKTVDGSHQVHMTGTFNDLPLNTGDH